MRGLEIRSRRDQAPIGDLSNDATHRTWTELVPLALDPPFASGTRSYRVPGTVGSTSQYYAVGTALLATVEGSGVGILIDGPPVVGLDVQDHAPPNTRRPASGSPSGPWHLLCDDNTFTITLSAPNGASSSYRITVTRACARATAPENVVLTPGDGQLTVAWDHEAGSQKLYQVRWRRESEPGTWLNRGNVHYGPQGSVDLFTLVAGDSYTVTGLDNGTAYVVEVRTASWGASHRRGDTVWVARNGTPRARVEVRPAALSVAEGGAGKTYEVRLSYRPAASVTVTVASGEPDAAAAAPAQLTFVASDWLAEADATGWQTVTVTAPQDDDATDETVTVSHDLEGHGRQTSAAVTVSVDDDDTARVAVEPLALALQELGAGNTGTYRVRLDTRPEAEVTVTAASGDPGAAAAAPAALTFDATDWATWQTVTVTAVPDVDGDDEAVSITHPVAGYAGVTAADPVRVTVTDYGAPGVTVTPARLAIDEGGTATYTVVLDGPPEADVTVRAGSGRIGAFLAGRYRAQYVAWVTPDVPTGCCTDAAGSVVFGNPVRTLTFTPDNWRQEQTVTVTAVENPDSRERNVARIPHSVSGYGPVTEADPVTVSVTNNDLPGVEVTPRTLTIREGGEDGYAVRPHTWPGFKTDADGGGIELLRATITASSGDPTRASVRGGGTNNVYRWHGTGNIPPRPEIFTVAAHADDDADNDTVTITHAVDGWGDGVTAAPVTVTVLDLDVAPPTDVQAAAGAAWVTVSWQAPVYTGIYPVVDYLVRWRVNEYGTWSSWRGCCGTYGDLPYESGRGLPGVTEQTTYRLDVSLYDRRLPHRIQVAARNALGRIAWAQPVTGAAAIQPLEFVDTGITVAEGRKVTPTLRRGGDLAHAVRGLVVSKPGTATTADYSHGSGSYRFHFADGEATASTVPLRADFDDEVEEDETFTLTITTVQLWDDEADEAIDTRAIGSGYRRGAPATVTITDRTSVVAFADAEVRHDETDADSIVRLTLNIEPPLPAIADAGHRITVAVDAGGADTAGAADYTAPPASLALPAGAATVTIAVPVVGDRLIEGDETFSVTLTAAKAVETAAAGATVRTLDYAGYALGKNATVTVTIVDDDRGVLALAAAESRVAEAPDAAFALNLVLQDDADQDLMLADDLQVTVTPTFTAGADRAEAADMIDSDAQKVTLAKGSSSVSASFKIEDDEEDEPPESLTFTVTATPPPRVTLGTVSAAATINDDDPTLVTAADVTVGESAGSAALTLSVTRMGGDARVVKGTVTPTTPAISGTTGRATAGADFTAAAVAFTIAADRSSAEVAIPVTDDAVIEGDEAFTAVIAVTEPDDGSIAAGRAAFVTIEDDDQGVLALAIAEAKVAEAADAAFELTVTLQNAAGKDLTLPEPYAVTVAPTFTAGDGKAVAADLLDSTARTVTLAAAATASFRIADDELDEPDEALAFTLTATVPAGVTLGAAQVAATIEDDDLTLVTAADVTVAEAAGSAALTVSLTRASGDARVVQGTVTPTADSAGSDDYSAGAVAFTIAADASSAAVAIPITADTLIEGDEQFTAVIAVTSPNDGSIAPGKAATVTITDDDQGVLALAIGDADVTEAPGAAFALTVTLKNGADEDLTLPADVAVTVTPKFTTGDGKAVAADLSDATARALTITTGASSATASFAIADDSLDEPAESLAFELTAATLPARVRLVSDAEVAATITDDDATLVTAEDVSVGEGDGSAALTLNVSRVAGDDRTVLGTVTPTAASAGSADYAAAPVTFIIAGARSSASIEIPITADRVIEGDEQFTAAIAVTSPSDGSIAGGEAPTVTITDDDSGVLALAIGRARVAEGRRAAFALTVTLQNGDGDDLTLPEDLAVTVTPKFTAGTGKAVAADLSTSTVKTLTISAGSSSAAASFGIVDDALDEPDETLAFTLGADDLPDRVTLGSATEVAATIEDNDATPTGITLTASPDTVAENVQTAPTVTVTAAVNGSTRYATDKTVTVAVGAGTDTATEGTDYAAVGNLSIEIAAGAASGTATFTLDPTDDAVSEGDEAISVSGTSDVTVTPAVLTISDDEALPVAALVLTPDEITEAGGTSTVTARLTGGTSSAAVTLTVAAVAVTPAVAGDFTLSTAKTLTIAAGATSSTGAVTITAVDNDVDAAAKEVTVSAAASGGHGVAAPTNRTLTITDDDPTLVTGGDVSVGEGDGSATLTLSVTRVSGDTSVVQGTVTPTAGTAGSADYTAGAVSFTIAADKSSASVEIPITDDSVIEGSEQFTAVIAVNSPNDGTFAAGTAPTITITDNDTGVLALAIADASVAEAQDAAFALTVTLKNSSGEDLTLPEDLAVKVTPKFTTGTGKAVAADLSTSTAKTLTITTGTSSATGSFGIEDDALDEPDEALAFKLTADTLPTGVTLGSTIEAAATIEDNDATPSGITLQVSPTQVDEDVQTAPAVTVTAAVNGSTRYVGAKRVTVAVGASGDTATEGTDYAAVGDLSIDLAAGAASGTATFTLDPTDDAVSEGDEAISVSGTSDVTVTGTTLTISDDDPTLVTGGDVSVGEGDGSATLTLNVTRMSGDTSVVQGTVTPKEGSAGSTDYTAGAVSFTIAADKSTASVEIPITDDSVVEGSEQFTAAIAVTSPSDGTFAGGTAPTVTITDDDTGVLALAISDASVAEAQDAAFALTVTLKNSDGDDLTLPEDLAVKVTPKFTTGTSNAAAADLSTSTAKTVTITKGSSSATVSFGIVDDALDEPDEALAFKLTADSLPTGVTLGSATDVAATIEDNDATVVTGRNVSVGEGDGTATLTLNVTRVSGDTSVVQGTVTPTAGTAGSADYTATAVSFTIAADKSSASVEIPITDDSVIEGSEQFTAVVAVSSPNDGTFAGGTAPTVTITDDDTGVLALAIADASVAEAQDAAFALTVTLKNSGGTALTLPEDLAVKVTPKFTTGTGKAVAADLSDNTAKTLTISTGSSSAAASFGIVDDALDEPDEALAFKLSATTLPTGVTLGSATEVAATIEDDDGAPSGITLTVSPDTVAENVQTAPAVTVTAAVNGSTRYVGAKRVTVAVGASADTATEGTDYAAVGDLSIDIAAGAASGTATFTLDPTDDAVSEGDEAISVTGTSDVTVTPAVLTISDDEALPEAALVLTPDEITENGGTSTVTARLTGGTSSAAVTLTVAAQAVTPAVAGDFTLSTAKTLTIAAGATSSTGAVTITAVDNDVDAAAKEVTVSAAASGGHGVAAPTNRTLTITDDDPTLVTGGDVSVGEGDGSATLTLSVTRVSGDTSVVQGTVTPTAGTAGSADYTAGAVSFTIAGAKSSASVEIPITDDSVIEGSEQFTAVIAVSSPNDGTFAAGTAPTITITDDDAGVLALAISDASVAEAPSAAFALTVTLKNSGGTALTLPEDLTVKVTPTFTTGTGKAVAADLSDSTAKTLTISTGSSSAAASFGIVDDALDEPDESLAFRLTADNLPTGVTLGSATEVAATIEDNDAAPSGITLTASPDTVAEDVASAPTVTVRAAVNGSTRYPADKRVTVAVGASGDSAKEGTDYATVSDLTITIKAGTASAQQTFTLTPTDDDLAEGSETISVAGSSDVTVTGDEITLTDDEELPTAALVLTPATITEDGGTSTVTATLTVASSEAVTLTVAAQAVTPAVAGDFTLSAAKTLTIAAGATSSTGAVTITASDNAVDAADKEVTVSAAASGGHGVAAPANRTLTITDDDPTLVTGGDVSVGEGDGSATLTLNVTRVSGDTSVVQGTVTPTAGTAGSTDYTATALSFTIAADKSSASVEIPITDDSVIEGTEQFTAAIAVSSPSDGTFAGGTAPTVTITDNDAGVLALAIADASVAEAQDAAFALTVTLKNSGGDDLTLPENLAVKVTPKFTAGTSKAAAADLSDNTAKTLTISTGTSSATASFGIEDDALDEPDEALAFKLTADSLPTGVTLGSATEVAATIEDNDAAPSGITLSVSPDTVAEDVQTAPAVTVTAAVNGSTRYVGAKRVTVAVGASADTATEGTDYAAVGDLSIDLAAGAASGTATFTLDPTDDAVSEGDEAISVTGTSDVTVTGTVLMISDDEALPVAALVLTPDEITEAGGTSTVTARLTGGTSSAAVTLTVAAVAVTPAVAGDFTLSTAKTLTIAAGATSSTGAVTITAVDNAVDAAAKKVKVSAAASGGHGVAAPANRTLTITDDDPTLVTGGDVSVGEGDGTATLTLSVTRVSGDTSVVQGTVTPTAGTAGSGAGSGDYSAGAVSFTIAADKSSADVEIPITDDSVIEGSEQFTATIAVTSPSDGTFAAGPAPTVTITDDDTGVLALAIADASVAEAQGAAFALTVTLKNSSGDDLTLPEDLAVKVTPKFTTGTGKAVAADLSTSTAKTLTITKGSSSAAASFGIVDDALDEPDESLVFKLSADNLPAGVTLGSATEVAATIEDNDATVVTASNVSVGEGDGSATLTLSVTRVSGDTSVVQGTVTPTAGTAGSADYTASAVSFTIAADKSSAEVAIPITDDRVIEGSEQFTAAIAVSSPSDGTFAGGTAPTVTITDDDTGVLALAIADASVAEAQDAAFALTVTLKNGEGDDLTLPENLAVKVTPKFTTGTGKAVAADLSASTAKTLTISTGTSSATASFGSKTTPWTNRTRVWRSGSRRTTCPPA